MRRLAPPTFDAWDTTSLAASKYAGTSFEQRVVEARAQFEAAYAEYKAASHSATWHKLSACLHGQIGQEILSDLTKGELTSLYSEGLVKGAGGARDIYDQIKVSAEGKCPYCGGIGDVDPLDHFLSKARYPQYAVLPSNLIPSCDRCNKLSGSSPLTSYESQTLNPYFDDDKFFEEPWISVIFPEARLPTCVYVFDPPDDWEESEKARALTHFKDFKIAERYAAAASPEIGYLGGEFISLMFGVDDPDVIRDHLNSRAHSKSFLMNGWASAALSFSQSFSVVFGQLYLAPKSRSLVAAGSASRSP